MKIKQALRITGRLAGRTLQRLPLNSSTEIRITRLCTQRCRQCQVYKRTTGPAVMTLEDFRTICCNLRDYGAHIGFISGGEALMVPHLNEMLLEARETFPVALTLVTGLYHRRGRIKEVAGPALDNHINIQTSLDGLGETGDNLRGVKDFAETVLTHMKMISEMRKGSGSLLYANIVLNNLNLEQVPELISRAGELDWKVTIGLYHSLTSTTQKDDELRLRPGKRLNTCLDFLNDNGDILNLPSFIRGIGPYIDGRAPRICAFTDTPVLATRTTIMEDGALHLCWGESLGNMLEDRLKDIFTGKKYTERLAQYRQCAGCWTTCYTQRALLIRPGSVKSLRENIRQVRRLNSK